jgi:phage terminase small subunit
MHELTTKQDRFVNEFLVDFDASKAAIRSGYSEHSAKSIGSENLSKPYIKEAIKIQLDKLSTETFINREMIFTGLLKEAMDRGERSTSASRVAAWSHLAKVCGLYLDVQVTTTVDDIIRDITASNAANRNGLLPKDNCRMPPLKVDAQGEYY